jgi:hypothetical protein
MKMQQQLDQAQKAELALQFVDGAYSQGLGSAITHPGHDRISIVRIGSTVVSWYVGGGTVEVTLERDGNQIVFAGKDAEGEGLGVRSVKGSLDAARGLVADVNASYLRKAA